MTDSQKKWAELFARPEPQTAEDIRDFTGRLNRWYWLIRFGVAGFIRPPKRRDEEIIDLEFWHDYEEYVKHVTS